MSDKADWYDAYRAWANDEGTTSLDDVLNLMTEKPTPTWHDINELIRGGDTHAES